MMLHAIDRQPRGRIARSGLLAVGMLILACPLGFVLADGSDDAPPVAAYDVDIERLGIWTFAPRAGL